MILSFLSFIATSPVTTRSNSYRFAFPLGHPFVAALYQLMRFLHSLDSLCTSATYNRALAPPPPNHMCGTYPHKVAFGLGCSICLLRTRGLRLHRLRPLRAAPFVVGQHPDIAASPSHPPRSEAKRRTSRIVGVASSKIPLSAMVSARILNLQTGMIPPSSL